MKNFTFLFAVLLSALLNCSVSANNETKQQATNNSESAIQGSLNITCSPELNAITTNWADEFRRLNPGVNISVSSTEVDQSIPGVTLYVVSDRQIKSLSNNLNWKMAIGKSAVVPIVNTNNPMLSELTKAGVSYEKFKMLLTNSHSTNWSSLLSTGLDEPVNFYYTGDDNILNALAQFINTEPSLIVGKQVSSDDELMAAIQNDIYGVGFCKLSDLKKAENDELLQLVTILPVDKNGNGRLDSFENIYTDLNSFTRGIWLGKYPSALSSNLYAASSTKPNGVAEVEFLNWLLKDGQQYLNDYGYSMLVISESRENTNSLWNTESDLVVATQTQESYLWLIIAGVILITGILVTVALRRSSKKRLAGLENNYVITSSLNENTIEAPQGLYFDKSHTWAFMEKDGVVRIGIDDFLQHITGTITRVKMKEPGESVRKGEVILTLIRNGKQLNIYAPVSGTIREYNPVLSYNSSLINSSPYSDGWVYLIEPKNWLREIEFLFMGDRYKDWLSDEFSRLKDFFAASVRTNTSSYAHIVLQDGGELHDNVLADLEPQVWEDFQSRFLDTSK